MASNVLFRVSPLCEQAGCQFLNVFARLAFTADEDDGGRNDKANDPEM
jgi:hypothetical protein